MAILRINLVELPVSFFIVINSYETPYATKDCFQKYYRAKEMPYIFENKL